MVEHCVGEGDIVAVGGRCASSRPPTDGTAGRTAPASIGAIIACMFDVDEFLDDCIRANQEDKPQLAIKELLERAMSDPAVLASALPPERAEITPLHALPELTVLKVVWTPGMTFRPHNHAMWAAIGIYTGGEDNDSSGATTPGWCRAAASSLSVGDTVLLGGDVIHAVTNPTQGARRRRSTSTAATCSAPYAANGIRRRSTSSSTTCRPRSSTSRTRTGCSSPLPADEDDRHRRLRLRRIEHRQGPGGASR